MGTLDTQDAVARADSRFFHHVGIAVDTAHHAIGIHHNTEVDEWNFAIQIPGASGGTHPGHRRKKRVLHPFHGTVVQFVHIFIAVAVEIVLHLVNHRKYFLTDACRFQHRHFKVNGGGGTPGSASKGGELGFVERGALYPEFEAAAFNLRSGEISQVVQTKAGYHIIQMIERRGDKVNVAHILLQPKPSADEQVKAIEYLDSVRQVIIDQKMDFSKAAMQFSDDMNKNSGGWCVNPYNNSYKFEKDYIDASTFATLGKLIPGEYSQPVAYVNEDGKMSYRIIYLKSKVAAHKPNLKEDYDLIKGAALEEKKQGLMEKWLVNKVKITNIKINENYRNCPFVQKWNIPE